MKKLNRTASLLSAVLLSLTLVPARAADRAPQRACAPGSVQVSRVGGDVEPGAPRVAVWRSLGSPSRVLEDGSWLYSGFRARDGGAALDGCSTLLVRFERDRVSGISLLNPSAVASLTPRGGRVDGLARAGSPVR